MRSVLTFIVLIAATIAFSDERRPERQTITTKQIANADVVGSLGILLGTCAKITATLTAGDSNLKGEDGVYFLVVTSVDGQSIEPTLRTRFSIHIFATKNVKLANNDFGLYELSTEKKAGSLNHEQIVQVQKQYCGKPLSLTVYESGGFGGMPQGLPKEIGPWADHAFHFDTWLLVVDQEQ